MGNKYLNGVVPCAIERCPCIATVYATFGAGTFQAAFFCDIHLPAGWIIREGTVGSQGSDIIRNTKYRGA
jgi:hypothetical protein